MTTNLPTFNDFDLDLRLLKALSEQGLTQPTTIQENVLNHAMDGQDILGSSPTGTGKTFAYLLPALQHLLNFPKKKSIAPRVLILVPTRELAMQVTKQAELLTKHNNIKVATITGGVAYMNHAQIFSENQDIVIATTGRLLQYINEQNFDCRAIEILILDEADRMLDLGFSSDIEQIATETKWRIQTLLFSATLDGQAIVNFAKKVLNEPQIITANPSRRERKKIVQYYYQADNLEHKIDLIKYLLNQPELKKVIVFVKKREKVHEINQLLASEGIKCCYLEGEMVQTKRNEAIKRMNNGHVHILIATDIAARGLDITDITHVINFDLPKQADTYLHRIGRTARGGKKGVALSLVEIHDYPLLKRIERYIQEPIKNRTIDSLRAQNKPFSQIKLVKKPKKAKQQKPKDKVKVKIRLRDKKNIGKRRKPSPSID